MSYLPSTTCTCAMLYWWAIYHPLLIYVPCFNNELSTIHYLAMCLYNTSHVVSFLKKKTQSLNIIFIPFKKLKYDNILKILLKNECPSNWFVKTCGSWKVLMEYLCPLQVLPHLHQYTMNGWCTTRKMLSWSWLKAIYIVTLFSMCVPHQVICASEEGYYD